VQVPTRKEFNNFCNLVVMAKKNNFAHNILVTKASGEKQLFDTEKLRRSLRNAGAAEDLIEEIISDILSRLSAGVTTKQIYSRAFSMLKRSQSLAGLHYRLKQAIMEMGPTGYPFEHLVGRIFEKRGYSVQVGQILDGVCVTHEVDVIATAKKEQHLMECKYHFDQGRIVSIQVPLYVRSRMDDIIRKRSPLPEYQGFQFTGWVVTNTRFSQDSQNYGRCSGLQLLSWDYPKGYGLKEIIERERVYPITVLSQLTKSQKTDLMNRGIVTCSQLLEAQDYLDSFGLTRKKIMTLMRELEEVG
jgi:hypothetical protein